MENKHPTEYLFMNLTNYTYLINKPNSITENQIEALSKVLDEFPFFQSARALRLKGLYNQNSFKYNFALKVTAAHTTDRTVLFDFITSESFNAIQKDFYDKKSLELLDINVIDSEIIIPQEDLNVETNFSEQLALTPNEDVLNEAANNSKIAEEKLAIGKPLDFSKNEKHSFQEWLQLSRIQPIIRENEINNVGENIILDDTKIKKAKLIDQFIESSPKISPIKHGVASNIHIDINKDDNSSLMTETLARVYLEQKKYQKAIQAYDILILKYPEKSSFFADRISDIKILQQNNNN